MLSGTSGKHSTLWLPEEAQPSITPDTDIIKRAQEEGSALERSGRWQVINTETFEGFFPASGWELSYQITSVSDTRCGVVLDDHWVDIFPQPNWLGSCDITVEVIDGIKSASDTFRVTVVPVRGRVYLPVVMRHP